MRTEDRMTIAIRVITGNTTIIHEVDVVCPVEEADRPNSDVFKDAMDTLAGQVYEMLRTIEPTKKKGSADDG